MPITASAGAAKFEGKKADLDDLIKRRFFFRQAFEIYGGVGGFFTYGPPGAAVKQNLIDLWRKHFVIEENLLEVDDTCIMPRRARDVGPRRALQRLHRQGLEGPVPPGGRTSCSRR